MHTSRQAPAAVEELLAALEAQLGEDRPPLRLGLIVPSSNTVMEPDLYGQLPTWVTVHSARAYLEEVTAEAQARMLDQFVPEAVRELATLEPHVVVLGCTSAAVLRGNAHEADLVARIGRELGGVPCISAGAAVRQALARLRARRVWLVTPYEEEVTARVADSLRADGVEVVHPVSVGIRANRAIGRVRPEELVRFVRAQQERLFSGQPDVDAAVVPCTNLQAMAARRRLESLLGAPVVTSNGAVVQAALAVLEAIRQQGKGQPPQP